MNTLHRTGPWSSDRWGGGFTLIELMITVAVIGILAAIAIPSYQDSVWKGKRGEAKAAILRTLQTEERWYTQNNTYQAFSAPLAAGSPFSTYSADSASNSHYSVSAAGCATGIAQCVVITATVVGNADPKCGASLSMDSTGNKLPTTSGCW
ncbi:MAG: type IV pilin protein [Burkholderiaceae bacterium]